MSIFILTHTLCSAQEVDSIIPYDSFNLRGHTDRTPEFFQCIDSKQGKLNIDKLDYCLARGIPTEENISIYPIKRVLILSEFDLKSRPVRSSYRDMYASIFRLELDKAGHVSNIETISHCVESISENQITDKLLLTIWRPALKDLLPVPSKIILEITYKDEICHEEYWAKYKLGLHQWFPTYRKELMAIYLEKGVMWDLDILLPMMTYKDSISLSKSFDSVELKGHHYIDSLNTEFMEINKTLTGEDCRKTSGVTSKWNDRFYFYMEKELKEELKRNKH